MSEAVPNEEPSVLISVVVLSHLVDAAAGYLVSWEDRCDAIEEAESALERYK